MNDFTPTLFFTLSFTFMCTIVNSMELATPLLGSFFLDHDQQNQYNIDVNNEVEECSICYHHMSKNDTSSPLLTLHCNHTFHTACITAWLKVGNSCPFCRADFLLHGAVTAGNIPLITQLINNGMNINEQNIDGNTPLHLATYLGQHPIVELLLTTGYSTKEHMSEFDGDFFPKIVRVRGADTDIQNNWGQTPLHIAAHFNTVSIARLLISKNANVAIQDHTGFTARQLAEKLYHIGIARLLPTDHVKICCIAS